MNELPRTRWQAVYYDGRSAARQEVTVSVLHQGLEIEKADGTRLFWPYEQVRRTQGTFSGQHARLERGEPISEALDVPDRGLLKAIHEIAPHWRAQNRDVTSRSSRRQFVAAAVALLVLVPSLYLWVVPYLGERLAMVVPVSWEENLGQAAVGFLMDEDQRCNDEEVVSAVSRIVERLAVQVHENPYTFQIHVSKSKAINALAAPGGHIVLFQGLIEKTDTPEQLAGVLAHEMQHVLGRHSTRAIFRELSTRALLAAMIGDMQGTAFAFETAGMLTTLHHRRRDEESADRHGMKLLMQARVDPRGMVDMFRHFEEMSSGMPDLLEYVSTHPNTGDRIEQLQRAADTVSYKPLPLLSGSDWEQTRGRCGSSPADEKSPKQSDQEIQRGPATAQPVSPA